MNDSESIAETIFIAARQLSHTQERKAYLEQACGDDRELYERVERLLSAEQQADQFFDGDPLELDVPPAAADPMEKPGSMIGRYKLLQRIGEGGCGVVYMAEQEEPIRRRVALKVIKLGMDTEQVIARFEAERQALAMMDHPHIARVLDAGATDTGRPYFVMELVRGIRITDYCDQNHLPAQERLGLFISVAQAIQHAHQKGVIHRDIKPSNVLVTLHDGVPVPKVIDFGVAKAIEQKLTDKTLFTQFEQFIGTPAYTSPEQAEMSGLDIDTRSDIYSLGVLLYELLVGKTPFDSRELLHSGLQEMRRIIREKEPNRPSIRVSTMLAAERTATALNRGISAPELLRVLHGDLDWIVMKCLEKDRTRRYETASGLAADIRNYLGNEPVIARPPSTAYRFGKMVRRNKLVFAAAAAVALALVAGVIVSTWQAARAHRAELVARGAEKTAKEEKESAEAVLQFVRDKVLAAGRPEGQAGGLGKDVTLRQAIDAAESQIAEAFEDRPLVEAAIRKTIGESYRYLGDPKLAVDQLERALKLRRENLGLDHERSISALDVLRSTYRDAGIADRSVPLQEELLKLKQAKLGADHPETLTAMNNLGLAWLFAGKADQALPVLEEAHRRKTAQGLDAHQRIPTMHNLAVAYQKAGKLDEAVTLLEAAVKLGKEELGAEHSETLRATLELSAAYSLAGKHDLYLTAAREHLDHTTGKLGPEHPDTLRAMNRLANAYLDAGKHGEGISLHEKTLLLRERILGPDHPHTLATMNNLAEGYQDAGKPEKTVALFDQMLGLKTKKLGPEHPDTLLTMHLRALAYQNCHGYDRSLPLLRECHQQRETTLGADHPDTLLTMFCLANATEYATSGGLDQALPLYEEHYKRIQDTKYPWKQEATENLADAYRASGKLEQAEAICRKALEMKSDSLSATICLSRTLSELALSNVPDPAKSNAHRRECLQLARAGLDMVRNRAPKNQQDLDARLHELADIFNRLREFAEAEPLYRQVVQLKSDHLGAAHKDATGVQASLGRLLADWAWTERNDKSETGDPKPEAGERAREAKQLLTQCLEKRLGGDGSEPWRVSDAKSRLGGALLSVAVTDHSLDAAARQTMLAEAETMLLDGHEGLQSGKSVGKKYKKNAVERLVRLYETRADSAKLAGWRQKLAEYDEAKAESVPAVAEGE